MSNPTVEQVDTLLTFLEEHQELARGRCRNAEGRTRSNQLWVRLTDELNALGGCTKTVKQWQKVWADKKYLTKKAAAAARRSARATGGGPSSAEPLNPIQKRILAVMGEGFGEPQSDACVPAFPEVPSSADEAPSQNIEQQQQQNPQQPMQHHGFIFSNA
ncbi:myb-related transcription factor, partner of profilin [Galleria mellonella]|uniref:Regulatory protein zeste n=1 Tax=Galleria mellonella TaxID=7137 RepID=A0ABM3MRV1_GALME|nr:myb-related transcription factor, partner of profilin [Galleria mellonella]